MLESMPVGVAQMMQGVLTFGFYLGWVILGMALICFVLTRDIHGPLVIGSGGVALLLVSLLMVPQTAQVAEQVSPEPDPPAGIIVLHKWIDDMPVRLRADDIASYQRRRDTDTWLELKGARRSFWGTTGVYSLKETPAEIDAMLRQVRESSSH